MSCHNLLGDMTIAGIFDCCAGVLCSCCLDLLSSGTCVFKWWSETDCQTGLRFMISPVYMAIKEKTSVPFITIYTCGSIFASISTVLEPIHTVKHSSSQCNSLHYVVLIRVPMMKDGSAVVERSWGTASAVIAGSPCCCDIITALSDPSHRSNRYKLYRICSSFYLSIYSSHWINPVIDMPTWHKRENKCCTYDQWCSVIRHGRIVKKRLNAEIHFIIFIRAT